MSHNQSVNVRMIVLNVLMAVMEDGEYSDKAIHKALDTYNDMDKRDRSFLTRLSEGTIERCIELDYIIDMYSKTKVRKMKSVIRNILRMGVYQILYMEQIPDSAACNEAVKLAVKRKFINLKGFVNGVLRTISREKDNIKYPDRSNFIRYAMIKYSMPEWIVKRYVNSYGEEKAERILRAYLSEDKAISVRCNISKASVKDICKLLENDGVTVSQGRLSPYALYIENYGRITELEAFKKGLIQVQDESSMLVGSILEAEEGYNIIDTCAAPGGKSIHAADLLKGTGKVISCDLTEAKAKLIMDNVSRNGFNNIEICVSDALVYNKEWEEKADIVIADLPCSGLGVIGKKCDIKYKTREEDIRSLSSIQKNILKNVSGYVKKGGRLIFSTCTIAEEENEENVKWINENLPLKSVSIEEDLPPVLKNITGNEGYLQILPYMADTDGFFISAFIKK